MSRYQAYVIYGGREVYARSERFPDEATAREVGTHRASPAEKAFIGVVDWYAADSFSRILQRKLQEGAS